MVLPCLFAIAMMACGPSESDPDASPKPSPEQSGKSSRVLLLSEESAITILQSYLQGCLGRWSDNDVEQDAAIHSWLMGLATGTIGDIVWSARYHGVAEHPDPYVQAKVETWVVIGPGLEGGESRIVVPGRWRVYAGRLDADYLDVPANLAREEYNRVYDDGWITTHTCR